MTIKNKNQEFKRKEADKEIKRINKVPDSSF